MAWWKSGTWHSNRRLFSQEWVGKVGKVHGTNDFSNTIVELCAGSGAMGVGPIFLGASLSVSEDNNHMACTHLRANGHGHVIEKDLRDSSVVLDIYQVTGSKPTNLMLGFPCQPHSLQGQQRRQDDPRAEVFWHSLKVAFLLQAQTLTTECVAAASEDMALLSGFQSLCGVMNWQFHDVHLRLEHQWPCMVVCLVPNRLDFGCHSILAKIGWFPGNWSTFASMGNFLWNGWTRIGIGCSWVPELHESPEWTT